MDFTDNNVMLFALVMFVITCVIWYVIIKSAVSAANKPLEEKLQRLIELKEIEIGEPK